MKILIGTSIYMKIYYKNTITKLNTQYATNYDMVKVGYKLEICNKTCWRFYRMYTFCRLILLNWDTNDKKGNLIQFVNDNIRVLQ